MVSACRAGAYQSVGQYHRADDSAFDPTTQLDGRVREFGDDGCGTTLMSWLQRSRRKARAAPYDRCPICGSQRVLETFNSADPGMAGNVQTRYAVCVNEQCPSPEEKLS